MTNPDTGEQVNSEVEVGETANGHGPLKPLALPGGWKRAKVDIGPIKGIVLERTN